MYKQAPHAIVMVRPAAFGMNSETAASNAFQKSTDETAASIQQKALAEFDAFVLQLLEANIEVIVIEDTPTPIKPDAIFPNNWISFQPDGSLVLYPMLAEIRAQERRPDIAILLEHLGFQKTRLLNYTVHELSNTYLEGTGSIVFDHVHRTAYAAISPRTDVRLFEKLCAELGYIPVSFEATDPSGKAIYHTNVMMHIGTGYAVICSETIADVMERALVLENIKSKELEVIEISWNQLQNFAGNMLEVENTDGETLLIMSESAFQSLSDEQLESLENYAEILHAPLDTIEKIGGGSARCMLAGVHWERPI